MISYVFLKFMSAKPKTEVRCVLFRKRRIILGRVSLNRHYGLLIIFTARCTIVQSAVLRLHVVSLSALSVCLSVRLSETLVDQDHIGWKSWKLTTRTISPTPSLFVDKRSSTYSQGNVGKFWGD